jgi:serine/threonine-protein kinase
MTVEERQEAETWFLREATLLSTLRHPLIPRFYRAIHAHGRRYLVQEYVQGETLDQYLRRQGPIGERQALDWGRVLCELLLYLHGQPAPIIFRDLKPANILLRTDGRLAVVDFGIARPYRPHQIGTVIGTPGYAPPEQYQGLASPLSDVYALGATLHRMLTGYDPEKGPPFTFPPVRDLNPQVSVSLAELLRRSLCLRPSDRPSLERMAAALQSIAERESAQAAMYWTASPGLSHAGRMQRYFTGVGLAASPLVAEYLFGVLHFYEMIAATFMLMVLAEGAGFFAALGSLFVERARWVGLGALTVQALLLYWFFSMPLIS